MGKFSFSLYLISTIGWFVSLSMSILDLYLIWYELPGLFFKGRGEYTSSFTCVNY